MINYTDFGPYYSMEEATERITFAFLQRNTEIISIETLDKTPKKYVIRVWWLDK